MGTVNLSKVTVNLSKGDKINLSKASKGLKKVLIGLGWDPVDKCQTFQQPAGFFSRLFGKTTETVTRRVESGEEIDCDAWVCLLKDGDFSGSEEDLIYYHNLNFRKNGETIIIHHGDNLTGEGDGDDEEISIDLSKMPNKYDGAIIGVTIYRGAERNQSFGSIKNTFIRIVDEDDNFEICRFNQADMSDMPSALTFIAGKLYKDNGEWQFKAIGDCTMDKSIAAATKRFM